MRKSLVLGISAMAMFSLPALADYDVKMKMLPVFSVNQPVMTDTINVRGEKPDVNRLMLEYKIPLSDKGNFTVIDSDSDGTLRIPGDSIVKNSLVVLNTSLRSNKFFKTKLKVKTPSRFELYINGERKQQKLEVQDSLANSKETVVDLVMEPETLYDVSLKMLFVENDSCTTDVNLKWDEPKDSTINILCGPELKERYLLPNTVYGNYVGGVSISPDGKYLLTKYVDNYSQGKSNTYSVLSEVKTGKKITTLTQGAKSLNWTPKSNLYYTVQSDMGVKIIFVDPETLEERVFADNVPDGNFRWADDEQTLFFTDAEEIKGDPRPVHRLLSSEQRSQGSCWRWFISKYDLRTQVRERLTYGYRSSFLQDVSSDGKYMLYTVSQSVPDKWPFSSSSLYMMDLNSHKVDTLIENDMFMGGASFSPDNSSILLTGGPEAFGGIGKNCAPHSIGNNYDTQAYIMNLSDRKIIPITKNFNPTVSSAKWSRYDNNIYFKTVDGSNEPVYKYIVAKDKWERLPFNGDCVRSLSVAENSPYIAYTSVTASSKAAGYMYDIRKNKSSLLGNPYARELENIELGTINDWSFTASDGTEITGYYCLPPNFDSNKKYPMIVYYYGGTTPTNKSMDSPYSAQVFASRNYVVLVINPSGAIGFGQEFSARHVNAWGKRTADDIIEGTKKFCDEHSYVDSSKIGCLGASYGGFMTQYLQTQTDIFAAAASHAGISNVTSYWGEGYWGVGYNAVAAAKSYPWSNPELFTMQGSLFNADKINTPLLLLHGTSDTNVPIGESIQLYNALKILGKTVEFIQVDGEDHFIMDYNKRVKWHNSIMAWFAKWLQGDSSWWDSMYPKFNR